MNVTVFCGAREGNKLYLNVARAFGEKLAKKGHNLVYGGGSLGLMGAVSYSALQNKAFVTGIMPKLLIEREGKNKNVSEFIEVYSMHERKAIMSQMADCFVTLPGGLGTYEELFEVWTHNQLGYFSKPIGILNINGFFDKLLDFMQHCVDETFIDKKYIDMVVVTDNCEELLTKLEEKSKETQNIRQG